MTIAGVGWAGATGSKPPLRPKPGGPLFRMAEDGRADEASTTAPVLAASMPSLLAMQEHGSELVGDREARRHGDDVLDQLRAIQMDLLGGAGPDRLAALAALMRGTPRATDPGLAAVQRALLVRVAVELARSRTALSE